MLKKLLVAGALTALVMGLTTSSAWAWDDPSQNGRYFIYQYHSYAYMNTHSPDTGPHGLGSESHQFGIDINNLNNDYFETGGDGKDQEVKNNAGSAYNETEHKIRVFYNSFGVMGCWCGSVYDDINFGGHDLQDTYNENASHHMRVNTQS